VIGYLCQRLGLVPIVGFLVAGVIIGPQGLGLVPDREMADAAAEVGVVLLLFTIGIEFSLEKLARIRNLIFGGGGLQVGLATAATYGLCTWLGASWQASVFTGLLVSLSSTAIVLKLLADRGETQSDHGQVGLGLLIFQDLAIVVMVLLVPVLASGGSSAGGADIAFALGKAVALIIAVLVFARRLLPRLLEKVAETCAPEIFLLTVMALCFGTAWLTSLAGVSLSLGAFLAGLVVSESRFSEHALSEILPLQIVFSALFFLSVGMLLDLSFLVRNLPLILAAVGAVLVIKVTTTGVAVAVLGRGLPVAGAAALMLAQVGEFSFVLERAGREVGLTPAGLGQAGAQSFVAATVLLMVVTPPMTAGGVRFSGWLKARRLRRAASAATEPTEAEVARLPRLVNHVVVAGYGAAARRLVRVLAGSGIPFLVTTLSPAGADEAEAEGAPVLRGDASRRTILVHAGIAEAKMLVVADDDPATARRIAAVARTLNPTMRIVVRTRWLAEVDPLTEAGVDRVIPEELESVVALFDDVLMSYRVSPQEIAAHEAAVRHGSYALLRARRPAPAAQGDADWECDLGPDCFDSRRVTLRAATPATALAWGELAMRLSEHGLTAEGLVRGDDELGRPADDFPLAAGDELSLAGHPADFAHAAELFRRPEEAAEEGVEPASETGKGPPVEERSMTYVDTEATIELRPSVKDSVCSHLDQIHPVQPGAAGCEECLRDGTRWVHLRICMTCGHVGCCDSSPGRHATAHHRATGHPVVRSLEPGETWGWCYVDETEL